MAYHFKLEPLLTYRRNLEERAQLKLAREQRILGEHIRRLSELRLDRQRIVEDLEERKKRRMPVVLYSFYMECIRNKEREIQVQSNMIEAQKKVVEMVRKELLEKVKERKVIERVREKDYRNYMQEILKKELQEGDEQAVLRYGRDERVM